MPRAFADIADVECERKSRIKGDSKVFCSEQPEE